MVESKIQSEQSSSSQAEDTLPMEIQKPITLPFARCATLLAKSAKNWFDPNEKSPIEVSNMISHLCSRLGMLNICFKATACVC